MATDISADILAGETVITVADVLKIPVVKSFDRTSEATARRWMTRGVTLTDGRVIVLESIRWCKKMVTTRSAVLRFVAACASLQPATAEPETRAPGRRRIEQRQAERELQAAGIL